MRVTEPNTLENVDKIFKKLKNIVKFAICMLLRCSLLVKNAALHIKPFQLL